MDEDDYRRWHRNLARGSQATADDYRRKLARFLHDVGHTPASFAKLTGKECYNLLSDYIDELMSKPSAQTGRPVAGSGCAIIKKAVVSWLAWNEVTLQEPEDRQRQPPSAPPGHPGPRPARPRRCSARRRRPQPGGTVSHRLLRRPRASHG